jgi:oligoribonuclease
MGSKKTNLIWLDLEMTGLNPQKDKIIEIATLVTDDQLNVVAEGPVLAIHQSDYRLNHMDEWNTAQHNKTGLVERVRHSKIKEDEAVDLTLKFLKVYTKSHLSPLCGSTISHDRRFLVHWMPILEAYFHYRNVDVSSIKELVKRWAPDIARGYQKKSQHMALKDIYDSISELKYYREQVFNI